MRLYAAIWKNYNEDSTQFLDNVDVTDSLRFGTQLNGGYASASFVIGGPEYMSIQRYRRYITGHVVIFDLYGRRVYEGEITDVGLTPEYAVEVSCFGYFVAADQVFSDMVYPAVEYTLNWIANPSFEVNLYAWTASYGTATRITTDYKYGSACAELTSDATGIKVGIGVLAAASTDITVSLYAKNVDITKVPKLVIEEVNGSSAVVNTIQKNLSGLTTTWTRYEVTFISTGTTATLNVWVECAADDGNSILIDAVQVERLPYSTPYADGSLGSLYSWTGTAHQSASERDAWSITVYDVLKDAVEMIPEWKQNKARMVNSNFWLGTRDYTDKKVKEAVEDAIKFGYREDDVRPVYFVIYDHRIPVLFPEPVLTGQGTIVLDWLISAKAMLGGAVGVRQDSKNIFNKVFAVYDNANEGPSKTTAANDLFSQNRYRVREGIIDNGGNAEGLAIAEDMRNLALEKFAYPRQVYSVEISGRVMNSAGGMDYPYRIRAGHTIRVTDIDYMTALGVSSAPHTALVMGTDYDAQSNRTTLTLGSSDEVFEILMSRLGLGGGLQ